VAGTFVFGWLVGLALVFRLWELAGAPRWMMFSGAGYVSLMLGPAVAGIMSSRAMGRLAGRGWGGASLGMLGAGLVGLVSGLYAL
jgi:hypothetical protein